MVGMSSRTTRRSSGVMIGFRVTSPLGASGDAIQVSDLLYATSQGFECVSPCVPPLDTV
ncbi:MAG: hypothetical protein ACFFC7_12250 [Candidatus Hermodarchaeota archaeon]